jgi:carbon-monoxide dehydrogenase medium subunit
VIPAPFTHVPVSSVQEALAVLREHGDEARLLAGGHSLLPLMKLRLATPSVLVDVGGLDDLAYVRVEGDELALGALTRHRTLERSAVAAAEVPLLAHVAGLVGDPQVRNRGTLGGTIAHADPASDLPCALLALDATFVLEGVGGNRRSVAATEYFTGFWSTVMRSDEMLVEVRVPRSAGAEAWGYEKFTTRSQDWATVAVARSGQRVALASMADRPIRATAVEAALADGAGPEAAAALAAEGAEPSSDLRASAEYRAHLARVLTLRTLTSR